MKIKTSKSTLFYLCLGVSFLLHASIIAIYFPTAGGKVKNNTNSEFKMINANVVKASANRKSTNSKTIHTSRAAIINTQNIKTIEKEIELEPNNKLIEQSPTVKEEYNSIANTGANANASQGTASGIEFIPFYKVDVRPEYVYRAVLEYPAQAKRLGKDGSVILEADIDSNGKLVDVRIIQKAGFGFDEAASAMIQKSIFSPAYALGKAVAVRMRFTISFKMKG